MDSKTNKTTKRIWENVKEGKDLVLFDFITARNCSVGDNTKLAAFVNVREHASIGADCKISSHSYIGRNVKVGANCFVGHHVILCDCDNNPGIQMEGTMVKYTEICENAAIGSNCTVLPGVRVGRHAVVGAGSTVVCDIPEYEVWFGNPARKYKMKSEIY